jgi:hypothetical protein
MTSRTCEVNRRRTRVPLNTSLGLVTDDVVGRAQCDAVTIVFDFPLKLQRGTARALTE